MFAAEEGSATHKMMSNSGEFEEAENPSADSESSEENDESTTSTEQSDVENSGAEEAAGPGGARVGGRARRRN